MTFLTNTTSQQLHTPTMTEKVSGLAVVDGNLFLDQFNDSQRVVRTVLFAPNLNLPNTAEPWIGHGTAQLLSDGSFEFVAKKKPRSQARLLKKLRHGRISETKDGAFLLTSKFYKTEPINIAYQMLMEAVEAIEVLTQEQYNNQ